jgi:3'-phosphoadenosine 5'-phosphosulfate sulfotransferase (PAPS reductase)/FAD synthetase
MSKINLLSVSGGKDSTALILHAMERDKEFRCVFADTGHEHEQTYEYLDYLRTRLGIVIEVAKADFTKRIEAKREYIKKHWFTDLTNGRPGKWVKTGATTASEMPPPPNDPFRPAEVDAWLWQRELGPMSAVDAQAKVDDALSILIPTGNPFLDLCLWKGKFPSVKVRFCTDELKVLPIHDQIVRPILATGRSVRSWQGVRADESARRATYPMHERLMAGVWAYRPLLRWTAADVFALHRRHAVKPNPLYLQGMNRVGCMPCIMSRKGELAEIGRRFPGVIDRLRKWEELISTVGKRGTATFFDVRPFAEDKFNVNYIDHGIDAAFQWSLTERGGRQFNLFLSGEEIPACSSSYGLCEMPEEVK